MLRWRLLLGTALVAALVALFWFDLHAARPGIFLFPLALFMTPLAAGEMLRLTTVRDQRPLPWAVYLGSLLVILATGVPHFCDALSIDGPLGVLGWPTLALSASLFIVTVGEMARYDRADGVVKNLALAFFAIFYVGMLLGFIVQLRFVGGTTWPGLPVISLLVVVKLTDIGAYTVGRLVGKHKLAPKLSPGKTIEGVAGGLLFASVGAWLTLSVLPPIVLGPATSSIPWPRAIVYGLALAVAGVLGDLVESLIKRDGGFKDSSAWLPGFGGVLDLLDSLLVAAPVAYLFWVAGWFG